MDGLVTLVKKRVLDQLDLSRTLTDEEVRDLIFDEVCSLAREQDIRMDDRLYIERHVFNALRGLDILEDFLLDEDITEVMINGPDNIFYEKNGGVFKSERRFVNLEALENVIQRIAAENNKLASESHPIIDTRLEDGSRVNIILTPIGVDYPIVTIRKFPKESMNMDKLLELDSVSEELVEFLAKLVKSGYNIFVCGGTGSGKTSFLNALAGLIPADERVVTIEDSAELRFDSVDNLVRLEAREANLEGKLEVSIRDLVKASLRMRPDRVIVGECRGAEALEVLQAFNTGHDGSLGTGHSNSTVDMVHRLETMVLMGAEMPISAIRQQIASGIDIFVHLGRLRDKSRKVLSIDEVVGMKEGNVCLSTLYRFEEEEEWQGKIKGKWIKENGLSNQEKLKMHGMFL